MSNRNYSFLLISFLLIILSLNSCQKEDQSRLQASWSANDPIIIPFNNRIHEKNLGNLAPNPSFESGKLYYEKSNIKSFDINGWKRVGENIEWVNTTSNSYNQDEVHDGIYAVKIVRNSADETETTGEGILSDFIKVIPGNYSLKLFLRLENICPNQARIGTKMFDAVNIRLQYFDKNKIEIKGVEFDAFQNKKIDNSFKAYSLSNFWNIDQFGWGEVYGKTASFPFFDGDVPDKARYVKIFIGLKGTGKMWIDQVDFRFTNQNFTLLERLKPFFDSSFTVYDRILPKPKQLKEKELIKYFKPESTKLPVILISDQVNKQIKKSASDLKKLIAHVIKSYKPDFNENQIKIISSIADNQISNYSLILSIGENQLYKKYSQFLPDTLIHEKEQSYFLYQIDELTNTVFVNGNGNEGIENALLTVIQLFDHQKPVYYSANLIDYPDFKERGYLIQAYNKDFSDLNDILDKFSKYKLNNTYFEDYGKGNKKYYPFQTIGELEDKSDLNDLSIMVDFLKADHAQLSDQLTQLKSTRIKSMLVAGEYHQVYTDYNPDKIVFSSKKEVKTELQFEHIELLNRLDQFIKNNKLETKLEFLSPWSNLQLIDKGQGHAEFYYRDLTNNIPEDISYYWTGSSYCTDKIDYADVLRIKDLTNKAPILFDNSLFESELRFKTEFAKEFYAGKIRVLSIFEPYQLHAFSDFYKQSEDGKILLNVGQLTECNAIRVLTAADYFWNTSEYNPDKALWIVLNHLYGRENAINLIYFNDAYYGLSEICKKIEVNGSQHKTIRIARYFENELNKYFDLLNKNLNNKLLMSEIEQFKTSLLSDYAKLMESVK